MAFQQFDAQNNLDAQDPYTRSVGDFFDQNHPDNFSSGQNSASGLTGGLAGGFDTPVDPTWDQSGMGGPRGGELGPPTDELGPPTDPWGTSYGAPPSPYASKEWTGGPAPTFTPHRGQAPTYTPYEGAAPVYKAPTLSDLMNDPGYQARLAAGQQGMERSAAARGTLLTGGAAKALARYGQDYASNELGAATNRSLADFGAQNQTYGNNVANAQNQFANANTTYGNQVGAAQSAFNNANTAYRTNYGTYQGDNARTLSDYLTNLTAKRNAENDYWNRLSGLSGSGLNAGSQGQGA